MNFDNERPSMRIPTEVGVASGEPEIVRVARMFDEAQRQLRLIEQQRQSLDEEEKRAQMLSQEHANHLRALIDLPQAAKQRY